MRHLQKPSWRKNKEQLGRRNRAKCAPFSPQATQCTPGYVYQAKGHWRKEEPPLAADGDGQTASWSCRRAVRKQPLSHVSRLFV